MNFCLLTSYTVCEEILTKLYLMLSPAFHIYCHLLLNVVVELLSHHICVVCTVHVSIFKVMIGVFRKKLNMLLLIVQVELTHLFSFS